MMALLVDLAQCLGVFAPHQTPDRGGGAHDHRNGHHDLGRDAAHARGREGEIDIGLRRGICLRVDQLQLMAPPHHEVGAGFRADANPVHALGRLDGAIGLDADFEAGIVQCVDQGRIHLQPGLVCQQRGFAAQG